MSRNILPMTNTLKTDKTGYEDLPRELRAIIFQLRTPLRKEFLKEKSTVIFRNIKRFVLIKRAFNLCYELYNRELVCCDRGCTENGEEVYLGGVTVYQKKNKVFAMDFEWLGMLDDALTSRFNYQEFVHSIFFQQFASNCHASFVTDSRNLNFNIKRIVDYHGQMLGFSVSKVNLDDLKPFGGVIVWDAENSDLEDSGSDNESGPESDVEDSDLEDSGSDDESGPESDAEDSDPEPGVSNSQ